MCINKITTVFYSPTKTSGKVAKAISFGTGVEQYEEIDLTFDNSTEPIIIKDSIVVISAPVYSGRIAPVALERIKRLQGINSPAIIAAVYGNRDYDDALVELYDAVVENGFTVLSAGAFIGEHSFSREGMPIAQNRPDADDLSIAERFGSDSLAKLRSTVIPEKLHIKGNRPYCIPDPLPTIAPVCGDWCQADGMCIDVCSTEAIYFDDDGKISTDAAKCTLCCACVKACPNSARIFDTPFTKMLHDLCKERREPEIFL